MVKLHVRFIIRTLFTDVKPPRCKLFLFSLSFPMWLSLLYFFYYFLWIFCSLDADKPGLRNGYSLIIFHYKLNELCVSFFIILFIHVFTITRVFKYGFHQPMKASLITGKEEIRTTAYLPGFGIPTKEWIPLIIYFFRPKVSVSTSY